MWRTVFRQWIQNAAADALQGELQPGDEDHFQGEDVRVDVAIICALAMESGGVEDRLEDKVWIKTAVGSIVLGRVEKVSVALVTAGPGGKSIASAAEAVVNAHLPRLVIAAGFAGALVENICRYHIVLPSEVVDPTGRSLKLPTLVDENNLPQGVHVGRLVSVQELVRSPAAKRELAAKWRALAVDLETFSLADMCRRLSVPMAAVKVITDTVDEVLPAEVAYLMRPRKWTEKMGAVVGAIWHRPRSLKDLWHLQEVALRAGDILAHHVLALVRSVGPSSG